MEMRRELFDPVETHFIRPYNRLFDKQVSHISRRALAVLQAYEWPGNVREFSHAIQSAVMLTDNDRIDTHALPEHVARAAPAIASADLAPSAEPGAAAEPQYTAHP